MTLPTPRLQPLPAKGSLTRQFTTILLVTIALAFSLTFLFVQLPQVPTQGRSTIVLEWSGMRPDMISNALTPHLAALEDTGVAALDHHAGYPTTTLVNTAIAATGQYPGTANPQQSGDGAGQTNENEPQSDTGVPTDMPFWLAAGSIATSTPTPTGTSVPRSANDDLRIVTTTTPTPIPPGTTADLRQDQTQIGLQATLPNGLVHATSIAQQALAKGISVSYEGSGGTALLGMLEPVAATQSRTYVIDDQMNYPATMTAQILNAGITPPNQISASTPDADVLRGEAFTQTLLKVLLPTFNANHTPFLSVIAYPNLAASAASDGLGSVASLAAVHQDDIYLGEIIAGLQAAQLMETVNIIVTSDHGISAVLAPGNTSANTQAFTAPNPALRTDIVALMTAAAARGATGPLPHVGVNGVSSGTAGSHTTAVVSASGSTEAISIPTTALEFSNGSDTAARHTLTAEIVTWLQSLAEVGPIFVADSLSNGIAGVLPLSAVNLSSDRSPAILFSFTTLPLDVGGRGYNAQGFAGSAYADSDALATSGSLSRRDIHTIFVASGPSFKQAMRDVAPTGAIDLAPTLDRLLNLDIPPHIAGRPLDELLVTGPDTVSGVGTQTTLYSTQAVVNPTGSYLEVVVYENVNSTTYIHAAYAIHGDASQTTADLKQQALRMATNG